MGIQRVANAFQEEEALLWRSYELGWTLEPERFDKTKKSTVIIACLWKTFQVKLLQGPGAEGVMVPQ